MKERTENQQNGFRCTAIRGLSLVKPCNSAIKVLWCHIHVVCEKENLTVVLEKIRKSCSHSFVASGMVVQTEFRGK